MTNFGVESFVKQLYCTKTNVETVSSSLRHKISYYFMNAYMGQWLRRACGETDFASLVYLLMVM